MRKTFYAILLSLSFLTLFTTCKNPKIDYNTFSITEESIQPGTRSVTVSGEYSFVGVVKSMKLEIGLDEQLVDVESHSVDLDNQSFSATVDGLTPGTSYHYCYAVEFDNNHKLLTEVGAFTTLPLSGKPVVRTLEVKADDSVTFQVKCIVDEDFGSSITERGIFWGLDNNPSLNNSNCVVHPENGLGEYSCQITGFELNTTYFVRAYAKNEMGLSYAEEVLGFKTDAYEKPIVETLPIDTTAFTQTSAVCKGRIVNEGSSPVIQRGICWGITPNPDIDGNYVPSVSNENDFEIVIEGLSPSTTYYFCAYAINDEGTGYGAVESFVTKDCRPVVRIEEVVEELTGTAVSKCFIDDAGSSSIIERGVCWSSEHNPTIDNTHATDGGNELGSYSVDMADLTQGVTYYVCAYAKNSDGCIGYSTEKRFEMKKIFTVTVSANPTVGGTVSGGGKYFSGDPCTVTAEANTGYRLQYWTKDNELLPQDSHYSFTVTSDVSFEAHFVDRPQPPIGTIDGWFTINRDGMKVWFSQGNLQYNMNTRVWSLMEHQFDMVETAHQDVGVNYANQTIVSLFGWATSGYHNSNDQYNMNYQPWSTSKEGYQNENYFGYGPSNNMPSLDLTGSSANYDWGVYNQIMANGNSTTNSWRTLTIEEWEYVLNTRSASTVNGIANARFAKARVNNVCGIILFPNSYTHPSGVEQPTNINVDASWDGNIYNVTEFALMQAAGAVFLPAAGSRNGTTVKAEAGSCGRYWSVTYRDPSTAWHLQSLNKMQCNRCDGCSVRLVCPVR